MTSSPTLTAEMVGSMRIVASMPDASVANIPVLAALDWIEAAVPLLRIAHDAVVSAADRLAADPNHDPAEAAMLENDRRSLAALLTGFPEAP